jgi:hypothetical protein
VEFNMPYGLRYQAEVFWIGPGAGPMTGLLAPSLPGIGGGVGQLKQFDVNPAALPLITGTTTFAQPNGTTVAGALASADVTALTNAMAADIAAQMNASIAAMQAWVVGQP